MEVRAIEFTIPGKPIAMQRHRSFIKGGKIAKFNPQDKLKKQKQIEVKILTDIKKPITHPINLIFHFFFKRPKNHFGTGKNSEILKESAPQYHIIRPDTDNMIKFYMDVFNGIIYHDDSQVINLIAHKRYCQNNDVECTQVSVFTPATF